VRSTVKYFRPKKEKMPRVVCLPNLATEKLLREALIGVPATQVEPSFALEILEIKDGQGAEELRRKFEFASSLSSITAGQQAQGIATLAVAFSAPSQGTTTTVSVDNKMQTMLSVSDACCEDLRERLIDHFDIRECDVKRQNFLDRSHICLVQEDMQDVELELACITRLRELVRDKQPIVFDRIQFI
jgi:hypothetical protein